MGDLKWFVLTFFVVVVHAQAINPLASYNLIYGWKQVDFKFPSDQTRNRLVNNGEFIPENNVITGVKVQGQRIYLTVPRWRPGVPATLAYVDFNPQTSDGTITAQTKGPLLNPFPSWEMNQLGNCKAFQYVQSMEIDQFGRMWVVDVGRVSIFANRTENDDKCPPKLVLLDLTTGDIIRKYDFPNDVVSPTSNFLNDIAVSCISKEECYAYISDALDSKIVVYNYGQNRSWFVHHSSMIANSEATNINILGNNFTFKVNVDGITLSQKDSNFDRLYYCPLSSLNIFSVPTSVLRSAVNGDNLPDSAVKDEGLKSSQSDGLIMDANGLLFYGLLGTNGIAYFNTSSKEKINGNEVLLVQNDVDLQWPDTFGFDDSGYLYTITNRLQQFKGNNYDFSETNFRVLRIYTGAQSYMYSASGISNNKETIPPSLFDATPRTNQDVVEEDTNKYSYKTDVDHQDDKSRIDQDAPSKTASNSSIALDVYTTGILLLVLVAFVFHPAV